VLQILRDAEHLRRLGKWEEAQDLVTRVWDRSGIDSFSSAKRRNASCTNGKRPTTTLISELRKIRGRMTCTTTRSTVSGRKRRTYEGSPVRSAMPPTAWVNAYEANTTEASSQTCDVLVVGLGRSLDRPPLGPQRALRLSSIGLHRGGPAGSRDGWGWDSEPWLRWALRWGW
jgi:hypothetical protein